MEQLGKDFYEKWAQREFINPQRDRILKWKAINLANLVVRSGHEKDISTLCEVGGAEGTVLFTIGSFLGVKRMVNYELSTQFCTAGMKRYPVVEFKNQEFISQEKFDLIIMSDIIEHIQNDGQFIELISRNCRFALIKIPLEECITKSKLFLRILGRRKSVSEQYGPQHENGHLHGYTLSTARSLIAKSFILVDQICTDVLYFDSTPKRTWIRKTFGNNVTVWLFGGALFLLGKSKYYA